MENKIKNKAVKGFIVFLLFMFIMTFASRVIYAKNLPKVSVTAAKMQKINHAIKSTGSVKAQKNLPVIIPEGLRVNEVKVYAGDVVEMNQVLLTFDMTHLASKIKSEENEIEKLISESSDAYENIEQKPVYVLENMRIKDIYVEKGDIVSVGQCLMLLDFDFIYDYAIQLQQQINSDVVTCNKLYEIGDNDSADVLNEKIKIDQTIVDRYWQLYEGGGAVYSTVNGVVTNIDVEIGSITSNTAAFLISEEAVLDNQISEKKDYLEKIKEIYNNDGKITSSYSGTVSDVRVFSGEFTTDSAAFIINDNSDGFIFTSYLNKDDCKYLTIDVPLSISFKGGSVKVSDGTMRRMVEEGDSIRIDIFVENEQLSDGDIGELQFMVSSSEPYLCIEHSAVSIDENFNTEGFLYIICETEGFLGKEYIVKRQHVTIKDKNNKYYGLEPFFIEDSSKIVLFSSDELSEGSKVRILN